MYGQRQPFGQNLLVDLAESEHRTDITLRVHDAGSENRVKVMDS
jgi:hypothetical protein